MPSLCGSCTKQRLVPECCCRFFPALRLFPRLAVVTLRSKERYSGTAISSGALSQLQRLEHLQLTGLSLALECNTAAFTALTALDVSYARCVSIAAALPRLQRLELLHNRRVRLAAAGLQLPALTSLALGTADKGGSVGVDFDALPALHSLDMQIYKEHPFTAQGISSLSRLTQLHVFGQMPPAAAEVLAATAPSLRVLNLLREPTALGPGLAAALGGLRQLTALTCGRRALRLLPPPAVAQLQELRLRCTCTELLQEDRVKLGSLRGLRKVEVEWHYWEEAEEQECLQVGGGVGAYGSPAACGVATCLSLLNGKLTNSVWGWLWCLRPRQHALMCALLAAAGALRGRSGCM